MKDFRLSNNTHIGYVHLQVADLKRALHFYENLVGMKKVREVGETAVLSASGNDPFHILLTEHRSAVPKPPRSTGLYHIAIRYASRRELARAFHRLYEDGAVFQGFSDHLVSEAIYLADPDQNGVELYVDRPRDTWIQQDSQIQMATLPLDMDNLLGELKNDEPKGGSADPKTDIGHIHLHVSDLQKAELFYHSLLGFDVTQRLYPGALFLSAGGYHHHIGVNTWAGKGAPMPPADAAGLLSFGVMVPEKETIEALKNRFTENSINFEFTKYEIIEHGVLKVKDPDGIVVEFISSNSTPSHHP